MESYPVRRPGERRRLNPNEPGIAWLEDSSAHDTQPWRTYPGHDDGLRFEVAYGARHTSGPGVVVRPMFEIFPDCPGHLTGHMNSHTTCPGCDDWSRTTRCTEHPETGFPAMSPALRVYTADDGMLTIEIEGRPEVDNYF